MVGKTENPSSRKIVIVATDRKTLLRNCLGRKIFSVCCEHVTSKSTQILQGETDERAPWKRKVHTVTAEGVQGLKWPMQYTIQSLRTPHLSNFELRLKLTADDAFQQLSLKFPLRPKEESNRGSLRQPGLPFSLSFKDSSLAALFI